MHMDTDGRHQREADADVVAVAATFLKLVGLTPQMAVIYVNNRRLMDAQFDGLGVPPDKREHLFERFFRAHETITEIEGTGLGLSIVRDTAQSLGGRAWAEYPEVGSVFAFSLPDRRTRDQREPAEQVRDG